MEEKRISRKELAAIKRVAMNVNPALVKREKARSMIEKWTKEYQLQENAIRGDEAGIVARFGLRTEQVVTKVSEPTGKFDEKGRPKMHTKYVLTDNVRFDADKNEYVITLEDNCTEDACAHPEECICAEPVEPAVDDAVAEDTPEPEFLAEVKEEEEEALAEPIIPNDFAY